MGPFDVLTAVQRQQIRDAHATRKEATERRGTCTACDRPDRKLNKDGTVRHHGGDKVPGMPWREYRCPGSGQKPKPGLS